MKSNKALVVDFALTDREEEPEEGEVIEGVGPAEDTEAPVAVEIPEEGLSPNASKVQELADTLASEIEEEGIAASEEADDDDNGDEDF